MPKKLWLTMVGILTINLIPIPAVKATNCPDLKIIFARGSGEKRWVDQNYINFRNELMNKLELTGLTYEFEDLDYPAIDVANLFRLLGTFVSGGQAYEFGESVAIGIKNLLNIVNDSACKNTKYVLGGYSQGAMVVSKAINYIRPEKIIYAATFGDPKIYLPEGEGLVPSACKGSNLSNYRIYVPDCRVYEGLLGGYKPYQPDGYFNKLGTWCNRTDIFCSTHFSIDAHTSYVSDGLYADASKLIFDKICKAFEIKNNYISLHDTVILIDSTGSMEGVFRQYEAKALELAKRTFESGGRVALYDYRDINSGYQPKKWCDFDTCSWDTFWETLEKIRLSGGGDSKESLLSASFKIMKELNWRYGSTKSVVVFTDASYHNPDLDGVTFDDVVNLSREIDPVNFYVVTPSDNDKPMYDDLVSATDGKSFSLSQTAAEITDYIMQRFDSLPKVEEIMLREILPEITNLSVEKISDTEIAIDFVSSGGKAIVALNDLALGVKESGRFVIGGINFNMENTLTLTPISENTRGKTVQNKLQVESLGELEIPKAPNAGKR